MEEGEILVFDLSEEDGVDDSEVDEIDEDDEGDESEGQVDRLTLLQDAITTEESQISLQKVKLLAMKNKCLNETSTLQSIEARILKVRMKLSALESEANLTQLRHDVAANNCAQISDSLKQSMLKVELLRNELDLLVHPPENAESLAEDNEVSGGEEAGDISNAGYIPKRRRVQREAQESSGWTEKTIFCEFSRQNNTVVPLRPTDPAFLQCYPVDSCSVFKNLRGLFRSTSIHADASSSTHPSTSSAINPSTSASTSSSLNASASTIPAPSLSIFQQQQQQVTVPSSQQLTAAYISPLTSMRQFSSAAQLQQTITDDECQDASAPNEEVDFDPNQVLCWRQLEGECDDDQCPYQHFPPKQSTQKSTDSTTTHNPTLPSLIDDPSSPHHPTEDQCARLDDNPHSSDQLLDDQSVPFDDTSTHSSSPSSLNLPASSPTTPNPSASAPLSLSPPPSLRLPTPRWRFQPLPPLVVEYFHHFPLPKPSLKPSANPPNSLPNPSLDLDAPAYMAFTSSSHHAATPSSSAPPADHQQRCEYYRGLLESDPFQPSLWLSLAVSQRAAASSQKLGLDAFLAVMVEALECNRDATLLWLSYLDALAARNPPKNQLETLFQLALEHCAPVSSPLLWKLRSLLPVLNDDLQQALDTCHEAIHWILRVLPAKQHQNQDGEPPQHPRTSAWLLFFVLRATCLRARAGFAVDARAWLRETLPSVIPELSLPHQASLRLLLLHLDLFGNVPECVSHSDLELRYFIHFDHALASLQATSAVRLHFEASLIGQQGRESVALWLSYFHLEKNVAEDSARMATLCERFPGHSLDLTAEHLRRRHLLHRKVFSDEEIDPSVPSEEIAALYFFYYELLWALPDSPSSARMVFERMQAWTIAFVGQPPQSPVTPEVVALVLSTLKSRIDAATHAQPIASAHIFWACRLVALLVVLSSGELSGLPPFSSSASSSSASPPSSPSQIDVTQHKIPLAFATKALRFGIKHIPSIDDSLVAQLWLDLLALEPSLLGELLKSKRFKSLKRMPAFLLALPRTLPMGHADYPRWISQLLSAVSYQPYPWYALAQQAFQSKDLQSAQDILEAGLRFCPNAPLLLAPYIQINLSNPPPLTRNFENVLFSAIYQSDIRFSQKFWSSLFSSPLNSQALETKAQKLGLFQ